MRRRWTNTICFTRCSLISIANASIGAVNATGSTVSNLRIPLLKELAIPLIGDKLTQGKIAAVLSALDAKIDLNHRINAELEALAKTIYDYWFVQFDFPDAHGRPYKSSGGAMVWNDTLKREIPAGWGDALLGNIVDILDSKRVPLSKQQRESRPGSIPYYGATGIFGFIDDFLFDEELLLLAEDGSVMDDRGKVVLQRIWGKSWVNNHAHVLRPRNGWTVDLLYLMLRETPAIQMMSGSIQKKITQENLNAARILVAPDPIRRSLTSVLVVLRDRQKLAIEESAELTLLRDWLLPLLMNGQVRVA
ncbi:restriction endonuclease subunit S [Rhodanobacter sp. 115]|uniref:restriction endonuclease subunit S n=1 Tax=Rhodanobacter sp. FW021-MT20 TaxID=1162282 RepID=UPI0012F7C86A|nr:restriction endonuclease subunit S [Rhodanobacter sp. 115]